MRVTRCLAIACVIAAPVLRAALPGTPVEQWRWDGDVRDPVRPFPQTTPVVVELTDDNGDGVIDASDVPDVAFVHWGFGLLDNAALTALDGATGAEIFTVTDPHFDSFVGEGSVLAAADLDGDGVVELMVTDRTNLIVFRHDGTFAWSRPWSRPAPASGRGLSLAAADLDQDGVPEVTLRANVLSVDGTLDWAGADAPLSQSFNSFSQAVDIVPESPGLELLAGVTAYSATGTLLWQRPDLYGGATSVGDLDGNGEPEIVLAPSDMALLHVLDGHGRSIAPPFDLGRTAYPVTEPILADIDGDGLPEIVVPAGHMLDALRWRGGAVEMLWQVPIQDGSCCADATAFDFDGDGAAEIVYRDEINWYVFDGCAGAVLHREPSGSTTETENPVVANIDLDPLAEIVVIGMQAEPNANCVVAYEVPGSVTPRAIWNQKAYHVTNVGDDGSIPQLEQPAWTTHRTWNAQIGPPPAAISVTLPRAWVVDPSACILGLEIRWDAAVVAGASAPVLYDVYRSDATPVATCADARGQPPVATGLAGLVFRDGTTRVGGQYAYLVVAHAQVGCRDLTAEACTEPALLDAGDQALPDGVYATLRARHVGDEITLTWAAARALLTGEHFHLWRALGSARGGFARDNAEGDASRSHAETDTSSWLQFFDLRVANTCEDESLAEYPPGLP